MILTLPDLPLCIVIKYLDNTNCCKISSLKHLSLVNQTLYTFVKKNGTYNDKLQVICTKNIGIHWKVKQICYQCCNLTHTEKNELSRIVRTFRIIKETNDKTLSRRDKTLSRRDSLIKMIHTNHYIHFNSSAELTNFISKLYHYVANIYFDENRCCEGKGCEYSLM